MQQGFLVPSRPMRASPRAEPTARLAEAAENCRNHPASTRIGWSYGESRFKRIEKSILSVVTTQRLLFFVDRFPFAEP